MQYIFPIQTNIKSDYFASGGADRKVMIWKTNFDSVLDALDSDPRIGNQDDFVPRKLDQSDRGSVSYQKQSRLPSEQDRFETPIYHPPPIQSDEIPPQLASTLEQIIRQLDILTQTVKVMEERLTINEHKTNKIETMQRQIVQQQIDKQAQSLPRTFAQVQPVTTKAPTAQRTEDLQRSSNVDSNKRPLSGVTTATRAPVITTTERRTVVQIQPEINVVEDDQSHDFDYSREEKDSEQFYDDEHSVEEGSGEDD
jgi:uncharacterized protein YoxC